MIIETGKPLGSASRKSLYPDNTTANSKSMKSLNAIYLRPADSQGIASERRNQSVLNLKRKKKMADHDAQLLANRIAMLESEQTRLMKKIENTRRRADQINEVKKNNELRARRLAEEKER